MEYDLLHYCTARYSTYDGGILPWFDCAGRCAAEHSHPQVPPYEWWRKVGKRRRPEVDINSKWGSGEWRHRPWVRLIATHSRCQYARCTHRSLKVHNTLQCSTVSRGISSQYLAFIPHTFYRDTALHRNTAWYGDRFYWTIHHYLLPQWAAQHSNVCATGLSTAQSNIAWFNTVHYCSRSLSIFCAHM